MRSRKDQAESPERVQEVSDPRPTHHRPVLMQEALDLLRCQPGKRYVDATVGGGGYAEAILERSSPDGLLLGVDWDQEAVDRTRERLQPFQGRFFVERAPFHRIPDLMAWLGWDTVHGIVMDLGVSSHQLDDPERGMSFLKDGPLDMRMDRSLPTTAADLVNRLSVDELTRLFKELGDERYARRIARAIEAERQEKPLERTEQLASLIQRAVPKTADSRRIHPATRVFLALRLVVNRELEVLEDFLSRVLDLLEIGGRLVVVTFHSQEDRRVKRAFKAWARSCRCPATLPVCRCEGRPLVRLLTRKALRPGDREVRENPRARSARLRAVEKC